MLSVQPSYADLKGTKLITLDVGQQVVQMPNTVAVQPAYSNAQFDLGINNI